MSDTAPKAGFFVTAAAVVAGFLIFALIVLIAYLPNRPEPIAVGSKTPAERAAMLKEMRDKEAAGNSYGWVDQSKGIVRVPIERAMQLTIDDLNKKK